MPLDSNSICIVTTFQTSFRSSVPLSVKTYSCLGLWGESFWVGSTSCVSISGFSILLRNLLLLVSPASTIRAEIGKDVFVIRAISTIADLVS